MLSELLEKAPHQPDAHTLLAHVRLDQALDFDEAERLARAALAENPKLRPGAFRARRPGAARHRISTRPTPRSTRGCAAIRATSSCCRCAPRCAFWPTIAPASSARRARVLALNPEYSRLYAIVGEFAEWEHRYDDIVRMMSEASALDAEDAKALAQLGFNLIRAGDDAGGVARCARACAARPVQRPRLQHAEPVRNDDPARSTSPSTRRRSAFAITRTSAPILERYVPRMLDEAWDSMVARYGFTPKRRSASSSTPNASSFSVRTSGLPKSAFRASASARRWPR